MSYSSDTLHLLKQSGIDIYTRASTSPISLKIICRLFNLKYKKLPMDRNTCGMLVRSYKGDYVFINSDHPYTRRRFSVAHEVGHFFLGHDSDVSQDNDQNRWEEVQANRFASSLLMPDELFRYVHKEHSSIKDMASWLRVSPISVAIRCQQFGIRRMEAEFVKSEYYTSFSEVAATTTIKSRLGSQPLQSEDHQKALPPPNKEADYRLHKRNENQWNRNVEMLDKLRRIYGYD